MPLIIVLPLPKAMIRLFKGGTALNVMTFLMSAGTTTVRPAMSVTVTVVAAGAAADPVWVVPHPAAVTISMSSTITRA